MSDNCGNNGINCSGDERGATAVVAEEVKFTVGEPSIKFLKLVSIFESEELDTKLKVLSQKRITTESGEEQIATVEDEDVAVEAESTAVEDKVVAVEDERTMVEDEGTAVEDGSVVEDEGVAAEDERTAVKDEGVAVEDERTAVENAEAVAVSEQRHLTDEEAVTGRSDDVPTENVTENPIMHESVAIPDGTDATPDGTDATPDGTDGTPDGTDGTPDGTIAISDGTVATFDRTVATSGASGVAVSNYNVGWPGCRPERNLLVVIHPWCVLHQSGSDRQSEFPPPGFLERLKAKLLALQMETDEKRQQRLSPATAAAATVRRRRNNNQKIQCWVQYTAAIAAAATRGRPCAKRIVAGDQSGPNKSVDFLAIRRWRYAAAIATPPSDKTNC